MLAPVLAQAPPTLALKVTVQPAGRVNELKPDAVLALKLKLSGDGPVLLATRVKTVVVPGFVVFVTCAVGSGPEPKPGTPVAATELLVKSTEALAMLVSVSAAVADLVGSNTEVAILLMLNGAPALVAFGGNVAFRITL